MPHSSAVSAPTIADLWRNLRAWLADALRRGPATVMQLVTRKAQDAVARRLRLIESLLLKLLLIEAASLHPFPGRRKAASPGHRRAEAASAAQAGPRNTGRAERAVIMGPGPGASRQSGNGWMEDANDASTWRVRFRPRLRGLLPKRASKNTPPRTETLPTAMPIAHSRARKLARRLEALRRVIADPRHAIAALARRLRALGPSASAVARAIALSRPRHIDASMTLGHAMVHALDAAFIDSS